MSSVRTASDWSQILVQCQVRPYTAAKWAAVFAREIIHGTFSAGDSEIDDFLGQMLHESAHLERVEENLNYSPERLCAVWPTRFPSVGVANPFARNPEALANKVYGGRMGNTFPGEGWKYRGRGLLQVTGKDNYTTVGNALGINLVARPEMLATPDIALRASIAWWERKIPDAAMGDIKRITRLVNGGQHGLDERAKLAASAKKGLA